MSKPYIIAISGGSGSGKSTFVKKIVAMCGTQKITVLAQDQYYRDMSSLTPAAREKINYDHPDQIDNELLAAHLNALSRGETIAAPQYDFASHTRKKDTISLSPRPLIICEGIFSLYPASLRRVYDLSLFLDVPMDICLLRRLERDQRDRGRTLKQISTQYLDTVRPMFAQYVASTREYADVVLHEGRGHDHLLRYIVSIAAHLEKTERAKA